MFLTYHRILRAASKSESLNEADEKSLEYLGDEVGNKHFRAIRRQYAGEWFTTGVYPSP